MKPVREAIRDFDVERTLAAAKARLKEAGAE